MASSEPTTQQRYQRITRAFLEEPWAILPAKLEAIAEFIFLKASGGVVAEERIAEIVAAAPPRTARERTGAVAVLPILGVISHRANLMSEMSGGTSTQTLTTQLRSLVNDPEVAAIVLDIDSPGGSVAGTPELAAEIFAARQVKPIVAVGNGMLASAAYYLAAAAHEVVVAPSAAGGSIGVLMIHQDHSKAEEMEGVKTTYIHAGRLKVAGNPTEPLSDEGAAERQALVDAAYTAFTDDVARFRGAAVSDVRGERYGEGRVFAAREVVSRGMADRIATLDDTVARLLTPQGRTAVMHRNDARSEYDEPNPLAEVLARLDRLESRPTTSVPEPQPEPAAELSVDIEAIAAAFGEVMKEHSL